MPTRSRRRPPQPDIAEATYAPRIEPSADVVIPPAPLHGARSGDGRHGRAAAQPRPPIPPAPSPEPEPPQPEAPRRRSTVREPAPLFGSDAASAPPPASAAARLSRRRSSRAAATPTTPTSRAAPAGGRARLIGAGKGQRRRADRAAQSHRRRAVDEERAGSIATRRRPSSATPRPASAAISRLRVYTTRLLGRDPKLVLHGGGNTSVKTRMHDLLGEETEVLCVKGSRLGHGA